MLILGCDFHPSWQQVSWLNTETGEVGEQKLVHASGEAQEFYQRLAGPALIGMEATGNSQWFVEWVEDLGHAIWIGDAAQIRASYVRQQKTDKRDAAHILRLLVENRFPRLWSPSREQRDLRQLVLHRHKLVEIRSRVKNELQHLSMNKGVQRKHRLWSQAGQKMLRELPLKPWAACRREDLLGTRFGTFSMGLYHVLTPSFLSESACEGAQTS
jgi:transposase